jgi:pimeloyl-ACP methyl ester carboxylesterase
MGFIFETVASKSDLDRYPPSGVLIDIGGFRLHLYCAGQREADQPLIVIEAGSGSSSQDWVLVQPEIAKFARVCTYDRAGLGWSDPGPPPRSSQQYATELHTLLEKAGETPPYIFVAHSYGGHTVRLFTQEHPEDVVGMVLVDARHPSIMIPTRQMSEREWRQWELLARVGFFRLIGKQVLESEAPSMAEKLPNYPYPIVFDAEYFATGRLQNATTPESDQSVQETGPFGSLPLVVIAQETPDLFASLPPEEQKAAEDLLQAGQRDLTTLSSNSQFVIAEGSGHNIPIEYPEVIITTVQQMISDTQ